jgi:hypothetical protein
MVGAIVVLIFLLGISLFIFKDQLLGEHKTQLDKYDPAADVNTPKNKKRF